MGEVSCFRSSACGDIIIVDTINVQRNVRRTVYRALLSRAQRQCNDKYISGTWYLVCTTRHVTYLCWL